MILIYYKILIYYYIFLQSAPPRGSRSSPRRISRCPWTGWRCGLGLLLLLLRPSPTLLPIPHPVLSTVAVRTRGVAWAVGLGAPATSSDCAALRGTPTASSPAPFKQRQLEERGGARTYIFVFDLRRTAHRFENSRFTGFIFESSNRTNK